MFIIILWGLSLKIVLIVIYFTVICLMTLFTGVDSIKIVLYFINSRVHRVSPLHFNIAKIRMYLTMELFKILNLVANTIC